MDDTGVRKRLKFETVLQWTRMEIGTYNFEIWLLLVGLDNSLSLFGPVAYSQEHQCMVRDVTI